MKPTPSPPPDPAPLLAFGAHPDDIEFGCGGVIAGATRGGRPAHLVVCSRGEAGSYGSPAQRTKEAQAAAALLGASLEFVELDGDSHLEVRAAHALKLAAIVRRVRPALVLAPTLAGNQHPDHPRLGQLVRDAARLARYGGVAELKQMPPHVVRHLLFYAVTPEGEPSDLARVLIDVSAPELVATWKAAMEAHASQTQAKQYVELQLARARVNGLSAGADYAIALFANDPLVFDSLHQLSGAARSF